MPSPFPGMDPYLEDPAFFPGFHATFIPACMEVLYEHLPASYDADVGERVQLVEYPALDSQHYLPDVAIIHDKSTTDAGRSQIDSSSAAASATLEPVTVPMTETEEEPYSFIEIYRRPDREIVTVIELLSPSNKIGAGLGDYRRKRQQLLTQGVHLVEVDLLIGGRRLPSARPLPSGDYYAFVTRSERRPDADVYAWGVRRALPTIMIPLKSPDPDVPLDLAAIVSLAYDRGRYHRKLRYDGPPPAPISSVDELWARQLLLAGR